MKNINTILFLDFVHLCNQYSWFNSKIMYVSDMEIDREGTLRLEAGGDLPMKIEPSILNYWIFYKDEYLVINNLFTDKNNPTAEEISILKLAYPQFDGTIYRPYLAKEVIDDQKRQLCSRN